MTPAGNSGAAFLTARIDGKPVNFNVAPTAHQDDKNAIAVYGMTSEDPANNVSLQIAIFQSTEGIGSNVYLCDGGISKMLVTYSEPGEDGFAASTGSASVNDGFVLEITSYDGKWVKGIFSGVVVQQSGMQTIATRTITDGAFAVQIK